MRYHSVQIGEMVEYTSKSGRTGRYRVLDKWIEDVEYGPARGNQYAMVKLGRDANDRGFKVSMRKIRPVEAPAPAPEWTISVVSDLAIGPWLEDHYQTLTLWGVTAHNAAGRRFGYAGPVDTDTREEAEGLADRIRAYAAGRPEWSPVDNVHWNEMDPIYGSDEYVRQGTEAAYAARERADDPWYYEDAERFARMS
jgi:hypothetical protein